MYSLKDTESLQDNYIPKTSDTTVRPTGYFFNKKVDTAPICSV